MKSLSATAFSLVCLVWAPAASAEQVYLVIFAASREGITSSALPMESKEQCQAAGIKLQANNSNGGSIQEAVRGTFRIGYECILGGK